MSALRIVKGNTFFTQTKVVAKTYDGIVIQDFDLSQASGIVVIAKSDYRNIVMDEWSVDNNDINIKWKGMPIGSFGLEISGVYNGLEWRCYDVDLLSIVNTNDEANIPPHCIIREDYYVLNATTLVMTEVTSGGGIQQEQSDWNESDSSKVSYIKNKPEIPSVDGLISESVADSRYAKKTEIPSVPTKVSQLTNDAGYLTSHQPLDGYATEEWVERQGYVEQETDPTVSEWAKQPTKPSYTAQEVGALPSNTPIPSALSELSEDATHRVVTDAEKTTWNGKQDALVSGTNVKTINNQSILGEGNISIEGGGGEANVIESITFNGSAVPVSNKVAAITASIPDAQIQSDWNQSDNSKKDFIKNKPTIPIMPTNVSEFVNDAGYLTQHQDISGKANTSDLATVATSGSYNDLEDKPTIPAAQVQSDWNATSGMGEILNKPTIPAAQVQSDWNATTGMGVILNKPTIPDVSGKADRIPIVNNGTSNTTATIAENTYYIWGEVASLDITLGTPSDATKLSEYMFEFQSGANATQLSFNSADIKFPETPTIEANKRYQVSIVSNIALIVGV